jgi:phosphoribosylamine--glycine ligase
MKVLVIGGGGREHALVWKLHQSPEVDKIYCIPGNAGIAELAECISLSISDLQALADFAKEREIDLTVVGPENPLVAGIVDLFEARGLKIFGPRKEATQIEGSKIFAKKLMEKYNIPTAEAAIFSGYDKAVEYIKKSDPPYVVKADGLAAGKGVAVAYDEETALKALRECFLDKKFGSAGENVIIEECLVGEEVSVFAFTDGNDLVPMVPAQDYKPVYDGNKGPNTGGMGSYSPVPVLSAEAHKEIFDRIMMPTVKALASEGKKYKGVLYGGFILTEQGPKVLEFNCRFGDPETQAILPRFEGDLVQVILAVVEERLAEVDFSWMPQACVSVVAASSGYPAEHETGFEILGLKEASEVAGVSIFHAGTAYNDNKVVTAGGRVLNVSALGNTFMEARDRVYDAIKKIYFEGMHYRTDIALRACKLTESKV